MFSINKSSIIIYCFFLFLPFVFRYLVFGWIYRPNSNRKFVATLIITCLILMFKWQLSELFLVTILYITSVIVTGIIFQLLTLSNLQGCPTTGSARSLVGEAPCSLAQTTTWSFLHYATGPTSRPERHYEKRTNVSTRCYWWVNLLINTCYSANRPRMMAYANAFVDILSQLSSS